MDAQLERLVIEDHRRFHSVADLELRGNGWHPTSGDDLMTPRPAAIRPWSKGFFLRLALSYVLVPLVPPVLLLLSMGLGGPMASNDRLAFVCIYGLFGLATMIGLGAPLLLLYLRLGWTGFLPFLAGGSVCAAITSYALRGPSSGWGMVPFFTGTGALAGLLFRLILFGLAPHEPASVAGVPRERALSRRLTVKRAVLITAGTMLVGAFLFALYSLSDERRSVTENMEWQCVASGSASDQNSPHIESVRLSFLKNPRYRMMVSGPHLCSDLKTSGQTYVAVTFDVWGNRVRGLHGYNPTGMAVGSKQLKGYVFGSSEFRDDIGRHGDHQSSEHPNEHRFPLEVFK